MMTRCDKVNPSASPHSTRYWHRRVWALAVPIIIANVSTPVLGMVDTAVVGHLPSPHYLGAVAIGAVIFTSLFWLFGFLRMGTSGLAAQAYGADDMTESAAILGRALMTAIGLGVLIILLGTPIKSAAFSFFDTTPAVDSAAMVYYDIRLWAAPATLVNYALLGWFLGMQRAGLGLVLQLILNTINIILDLIFVLGLGWTVDGVAFASVLAEGATAAVGLAIAMRMIRRTRSQWAVIWQQTGNTSAFVRLALINRDIFLRTLCLIAATLWFTRQSAQFGETVLAATAILQQLHLFMAHGLDGFAHAAQALIGRTVGAGRRSDLIAAIRVSTLWAGVAALAFTAFYAVGGTTLIGLLTGLPDVRTTAATYLPWATLMPVVAVWSFQLDGIFIGATRTREMRNSMALSLVVFLTTTWLAIPVLEVHGLWLAMIVFMIMRTVTLGAYLPALIRSVPPSTPPAHSSSAHSSSE